MGIKHTTLRRSRGPSPRESSAQLPRSSSFAERLLPQCLMPEKSREYEDDEDGGDSEDHGAEQGGKGRLPTLEWLLASPVVEVQLHRRQSPKVCPLSPSVIGCDRRLAGVDVSTPSDEDHGAEQGGKGRRPPMLEEWLLASPGVEEQLHRPQSPKVCPLSPSVIGCDSRFASVDASASSSSSAVEGDGSRSFSRSESGRRRRVRFRLPAEGDIIVISSTTDCESTEKYQI